MRTYIIVKHLHSFLCFSNSAHGHKSKASTLPGQPIVNHLSEHKNATDVIALTETLSEYRAGKENNAREGEKKNNPKLVHRTPRKESFFFPYLGGLNGAGLLEEQGELLAVYIVGEVSDVELDLLWWIGGRIFLLWFL